MSAVAELIITAAQFDPVTELLEYVFVGLPPEQSDRTVDGIRMYTREHLIRAIHEGKRFVTAVRVLNEWKFTGEVKLIDIQGNQYLRVDLDRVPVDDLGNLARIRSSNWR